MLQCLPKKLSPNIITQQNFERHVLYSMFNQIIMRILIDMDEVMADAISRFLEWYERDFGVRYTKDDLKGTKLSEIVPAEHRAIVKNYPHQKGFFKNLPLIPNSKEV